VTREKLIAYLWPEADAERGRRLLSESLYVLRKALGAGALVSEGDGVRLDPEFVSCDVPEFEAAVERGDWESAISVYAGAFLDGFFVKDAPEFERWVESERRRLADCYAEALEQLAEEAEAAQDQPGAIGWWQRLLAHDPYNSRYALRLMRVLAAAGDPANAIQQAEEHASLLERELGVGPPEDLLAYAGQLRREPLPAHGEVGLAGVQGAPATALPEVRGAAPVSVRTRRKVRRRLWVTLLAVVATVAVLAIWPHGPRPAEHNAPPGIAVLPFSVHGEGLEMWREGMVVLLSTDMNGVGGLRTIDSRTLLARWQERVPETGEADRATALEVAQAAGARYALLGSAVGIGQEVRLSADIHDTEGGAQIGTVQVEGSLESVLGLVDRLAVQSLGVVLGQEASELPQLDLAGVTTASIPALTAWLEAEALVRRGDFEAAVPAYERAVAADSTFALAFYGLGSAYGLSGDAGSGRYVETVEQAMRWVDRLPAREAALVRAVHAWQQWALQEAEELLQRLVRTYPDYAEGWFILGELYWHDGHNFPVSLEDAQRSFTRAVELNPEFAPYRVHLIDMAFVDNPDSAEAARLIEEYKRLSSAGALHTRRVELGFDLAFGDQEHRERALASLDTVDLEILHYLPNGPPLHHPRFWPQWEAVWLALEGRATWRTASTRKLFQGAAMGRGYLRKGLEYLDRPQASSLDRTCLLAYAHTNGFPVPRERLEEAAAVLSQIDSTSHPALVYWAAFLAAAQGRWSDHARAVEFSWDLWRREVDAGRSGSFTQALALAVEAYGLWRQGDPEAALGKLEEVRRYQATNSVRWVLGQVLMDLERWEEAVPYLRAWPYDTYSHTHYHLARAYEGMGEYGKAAKEYAFFVEAWEDADPELQPWVEDARRALPRLTPHR
jgi:DNA-binding SARP family transcriptional activator/TolB-like protein